MATRSLQSLDRPILSRCMPPGAPGRTVRRRRTGLRWARGDELSQQIHLRLSGRPGIPGACQRVAALSAASSRGCPAGLEGRLENCVQRTPPLGYQVWLAEGRCSCLIFVINSVVRPSAWIVGPSRHYPKGRGTKGSKAQPTGRRSDLARGTGPDGDFEGAAEGRSGVRAGGGQGGCGEAPRGALAGSRRRRTGERRRAALWGFAPEPKMSKCLAIAS